MAERKDGKRAASGRAGSQDAKGAKARRSGAKAKRATRASGTRRALSAAERKRMRRTRRLKALACAVVLGVTLALALVVGDSDYRATAIGWVPFIACAVAILGAWVYLQVLKRGLRLLEKAELGDCRRGDDVKFTVRFRNTTPLFFFRIEAHFFVADLYGSAVSHAMTTMALAPFEKYDLEFKTRFEHIGTYRAGLDHVVVCDFLRLFTAEIDGPRRSAVQVVPRIEPIEKIEFSNEAALETTKASKSAFSDSMDYASVRDYVPGDPLKTIHWKLSARGENYLTRLFETYTNPGVAVIMDFCGSGETSKQLMGMFDCVVETAFSVARYAQEQGMETEIHYCDRYGNRVRRSTWRQSDLPRIVSDMPKFGDDGARQVDALELLSDQMRSQHGQNNLVVCTANISAQMVSTVVEAKMRRREPLLFAVAPTGLEGRDRDRWAAPLARLDAAGVGYVVLSDSRELSGVRA